MNSIHALPSYFPAIYFNTTPSTHRSSERSLILKFSNRIFFIYFSSPMCTTCPTQFILINLIILIVFGKAYAVFSRLTVAWNYDVSRATSEQRTYSAGGKLVSQPVILWRSVRRMRRAIPALNRKYSKDVSDAFHQRWQPLFLMVRWKTKRGFHAHNHLWRKSSRYQQNIP